MERYCWWPKDRQLPREIQDAIEDIGIWNGSIIREYDDYAYGRISVVRKIVIDTATSKIADLQLRLLLLGCPPKEVPQIWDPQTK